MRKVFFRIGQRRYGYAYFRNRLIKGRRFKEELKFATEKYFRNEVSAATLPVYGKGHPGANGLHNGPGLVYQRTIFRSTTICWTPRSCSTLFQSGSLPCPLRPLDIYFAMARGYQGPAGDVKALAMKKWFNTNYHYMVPEVCDDTEIKLCGTKPFDEFLEAQALGVQTKPVVIGPYTLLKLCRYAGRRGAEDFAEQAGRAYAGLLARFGELGAGWVQFDEPCLCCDMTSADAALLERLYSGVLAAPQKPKTLLQTYFGDVRDCYETICSLGFDGIGLDFVEGKQTQKLIEKHGFPYGKTPFAGVVNGKNIWKNNYRRTLGILDWLHMRGLTP